MLTNLYNTHILHQNKVTSIERVEGSFEAIIASLEQILSVLCTGARCENIDF